MLSCDPSHPQGQSKPASQLPASDIPASCKCVHVLMLVHKSFLSSTCILILFPCSVGTSKGGVLPGVEAAEWAVPVVKVMEVL